MCKKSRFRLPLEKENGKPVSTLLKGELQHMDHIYLSMGRQLSCKKSLVVIFNILRVFVCTLSVVDKYSFTKRDNLTDAIQMQLSRKQKSSCHIFSTFLKSSLNLDHCQKKDDPHNLFISEVAASENVVRSICKKSRFRLPFQKEHGKRVSAL